MNRCLTFITALVLLAGFSTACTHHTAVKEPDADKTFSGTIDKIDRTAQLITVQHFPLYKTFKVGSKCDVTIPDKDSPTSNLSDLKVGDMVVVAYGADAELPEATSITRRSREYVREKEEQYERLQDMLLPRQ